MFDKKTDVNIRLHLCPAITKKVFRSGGNQHKEHLEITGVIKSVM